MKINVYCCVLRKVEMNFSVPLVRLADLRVGGWLAEKYNKTVIEG